jgi:hypothetical protein
MLRTIKVLFIILVTATFSFGQKGTHTPYSVYGLGELKFNDYAAYQSMGGISIANTDSTMINHSNPAAYSYISRLRPIFQVGLNGRLSTFETETQSSNQKHFGLNQFQMAVPIKKRWGGAFGLKPYSFTGYKVSNYTVVDGDSTELYTNEGNGGINNFYFGVAYQPIKKTTKDTFNLTRNHVLSIGANGNYLFGSSNHERTFQYRFSSSTLLNSKVENSLRFSDMIFDFGLNYQLGWTKSKMNGKQSKTNSFAFGLTYSPAVNVRAFQDIFTYSYYGLGGFNGPELLSDTLEFENGNQGHVVVPESYKIGIEYRIGPDANSENSSLFKVGADLKYQKWSDYAENFDGVTTNGDMNDRFATSLGIEWTPVTVVTSRKKQTFGDFLNKIHYRMGFNYTMTEWKPLNNAGNYTSLSSYGMSFGLGIPITISDFSNTNINFGAKIGNLGTTADGLIQEKFVGLFVGISITPGKGDLWFLKRKYD